MEPLFKQVRQDNQAKLLIPLESKLPCLLDQPLPNPKNLWILD